MHAHHIHNFISAHCIIEYYYLYSPPPPSFLYYSNDAMKTMRGFFQFYSFFYFEKKM